jgi:hypothetical protein
MNQQPDAIVGNIGAFIFILALIFFIVKGYNNPNNCIKLTDQFTIGYIQDREPIRYRQVKVKSINPNKLVNEKAKNTKQSNSKPAKIQLTPLQIDCIDTLVAIGFKKGEAKLKVKDIFENNPIQDIQEFLNIALQKT